MSAWFSLGRLPLFATDLESFFRGVGSEFTGSKAKLGWNDAFIVLGIIVVIGSIIAILSRHLAKHEHLHLNHPRKLFGELCQAHNLNWRDRRALQRLAKFYTVVPAARVFVEPKLFDEAIGEHAWQSQVLRLQKLREQLFASSDETAALAAQAQ